MKLLLAHEVIVKSVHPYVLEKFRSNMDGEILKRKNKEQEQPPPQPKVENEDGEEEEYYDEENDNWLCDGFNLFKCGCKSGQTEFGEHPGIEGWSSSNPNEDFDLCEMCIRWCIHCESLRISPGFVGEPDPVPPNDDEADDGEPYLTDRSR